VGRRQEWRVGNLEVLHVARERVEGGRVDRSGAFERGGVGEEVRLDQRARHPKRSLKYLSGSGQPGHWTYRESRQGVAALRTLDWRLASSTPHFTTSLRALVADIADWLGETSPLPGDEAPLTGRHTHRATRVLRNL
jgi:hypothetical protein